MNLGRVKTYLIIILAIGNVLLAGLFGWRYFPEAAAMRQANEQLIALLANQGIIIRELPNETVTALVLSRDLAAESAAVAALLGETQMTDLGGGAFEYLNDVGHALFRSGGRFDIRLFDSDVNWNDDSKVHRDMLDAMGFSGVSKRFIESGKVEDTDIYAVTIFGQEIEGRPLYNARAEFRFSEKGQLVSVSGLWALGTVQAADSILCKSAGAALLLFSENRDIEVVGVELGYRLRTQTATAESARLIPEWRVICRDTEYYLDGFTGVEVGAEE